MISRPLLAGWSPTEKLEKLLADVLPYPTLLLPLPFLAGGSPVEQFEKLFADF
jgi:hypothetical protein